MGCGCGGSISTPQVSRMVFASHRVEEETVGPCDYTDLMLFDFKNKLIWFKDNGLYLQQGITPRTINKYLGIVLTSLNIKNKCYYKEELDKIADLVNLIITLQ